MDTPRRGLVRATESAIQEYIKEGCVENLPMIRQLEDIAYQIWTESNTSFLNETVVTEEDEEGWMWDEDYLYQSFSAYADDNLTGAADDILTGVADDNSSICSSIKPCDETDCSLGYLASCEDDDSVHEYMNISVNESCDVAEKEFVQDFSDASVNVKTDYSVSECERNGFNFQEDKEVLPNTDYRNCAIKMQTSALKELGNVFKEKETITHVETFRENHEYETVDAHLADTVNMNEDEWVIVNKDWSESVPNGDWLVVSVNETGPCKLETQRPRKYAHNDNPEQVVKNDNKCKDSENDKTGDVDFSDWAVLSMNITERRDNSEDQKRKETMKMEHGLSPDAKTHAKHDSQMEFIRETFGFKTKPSSGLSSVDRCPLCKNNKDNYKCAIVCLLMQ